MLTKEAHRAQERGNEQKTRLYSYNLVMIKMSDWMVARDCLLNEGIKIDG